MTFNENQPDGAVALASGSSQDSLDYIRDDGGARKGREGHILLANDDEPTSRRVASYFKMHAMPTHTTKNRHELLSDLARTSPGLIVLNLRMEEDNGFDLLREIRLRTDVPVIVTTEGDADEIDRIIGLELGADDCMSKPVNERELLARVRAILRRQEIGRLTTCRDPNRGGYRFNGWCLERKNRRLTDPEGNVVLLTKGEYSLLLAFLEAPQRPLTREYLLQTTRVHEDVFDRSIDVQVLRLRRKLEAHAASAHAIKTERGVGYRFTSVVEAF